MRRFESGRRLQKPGSPNPLLGWTSFLDPIGTADCSGVYSAAKRSAVAGVPTSDQLSQGVVVFGGLDPHRLRDHDYRAVPFGSEPVWETARWRESLESSRSLRHQISRARTKGVECQIEDARPSVLLEMELCREDWMKRLGQPQFRHDREYDIEAAAQHGAILTARHRDRLVGWLIAMPLADGKALLAPICRSQNAPQGTVEMLVDCAMRHTHREGYAEASMGVIPFAQPALAECPRGLLPVLSFAKSRSIGYRYLGVEAFRTKLRPSRWQSRWIAWPCQLNVLSAGNAFAELLYGERLTIPFAFRLATQAGS